MNKEELLKLLEKSITTNCEWEIWDNNEGQDGIIIMFNTNEEQD